MCRLKFLRHSFEANPANTIFNVEYSANTRVVKADALLSVDDASQRYIFATDKLATAGVSLQQNQVLLIEQTALRQYYCSY